mmetsp:Transcript_13476/g.31963  ORF Transcript_13476/g.31963 Transcript_13476/m.31963 type:complete len:215 (+) Transcript_13476:90-734(+)
MSAASGGGAPKKFKVVVLGDEAAGKTSLVRRYMYGTFEEGVQPTVGMDFQSKTAYLEDGRSMRLQLWDTAGQERFRSLIPSYIRDAAAAVIVYDITRQASFQGTRAWISDVRAERGEEAVLAVVGNKLDLADERQVSEEEGRELAKELGVLFLETSAKRGENVNALFQQVAAALPCERPGPSPERPKPSDTGFQLRSQEHGRDAGEKKKKQCKC